MDDRITKNTETYTYVSVLFGESVCCLATEQTVKMMMMTIL